MKIWRSVKKSLACEIERESGLTWIEKILSVVMLTSPILSLVLLNEVVCWFGN